MYRLKNSFFIAIFMLQVYGIVQLNENKMAEFSVTK